MADRLFLDANVLFTAAHRPEGKAAFLLQAWPPQAVAPWDLLSSAYALEEARRNLTVKFPDALARWPAILARVQVVAQPARAPHPLTLPDKDQPIWAAAQAAAATQLLTGDLRDFGPHMNRPAATAGITIQTVGDYLASRLAR